MWTYLVSSLLTQHLHPFCLFEHLSTHNSKFELTHSSIVDTDFPRCCKHLYNSVQCKMFNATCLLMTRFVQSIAKRQVALDNSSCKGQFKL